MLRNLSSYYGKDAAGLHLVRIAQGLLHMGKGLTTINPYHSDRHLLSPLALASLLTVLHCGINPTETLCGKPAYMLYYIVPAVRPRMLLTVDESGDVVPVSVRVGTAVDTVAQAGQPKSITGAPFSLLSPLLLQPRSSKTRQATDSISRATAFASIMIYMELENRALYLSISL
jgi:26S proteasome regulatory subunit N1